MHAIDNDRLLVLKCGSSRLFYLFPWTRFAIVDGVLRIMFPGNVAVSSLISCLLHKLIAKRGFSTTLDSTKNQDDRTLQVSSEQCCSSLKR